MKITCELIFDGPWHSTIYLSNKPKLPPLLKVWILLLHLCSHLWTLLLSLYRSNFTQTPRASNGHSPLPLHFCLIINGCLQSLRKLLELLQFMGQWVGITDWFDMQYQSIIRSQTYCCENRVTYGISWVRAVP